MKSGLSMDVTSALALFYDEEDVDVRDAPSGVRAYIATDDPLPRTLWNALEVLSKDGNIQVFTRLDNEKFEAFPDVIDAIIE